MTEAPAGSGKDIATLVYALQVLSLVVAVTALIAVIINHIKRDDVRGSWIDSHFRWQMRTFWFGLLWACIGGLLLIVLIGWPILVATYIWCIYRVVKGWLRLSEGKPMYT